ncbi:hypothetical protein FKM82_021962 [Ascaphus truei]
MLTGQFSKEFNRVPLMNNIPVGGCHISSTTGNVSIGKVLPPTNDTCFELDIYENKDRRSISYWYKCIDNSTLNQTQYRAKQIAATKYIAANTSLSVDAIFRGCRNFTLPRGIY